MNLRWRRLIFRALAFVLVIFFIYLLFRYLQQIMSVLTPFILGIIIAYVINPLITRMEDRGIKRIYSIIIVYLLFIALVSVILSLLLPAVYRETTKLIETIPTYTYRIKGDLDQLYVKFSETLTPELRGAIRENVDELQELLITQINKIIQRIFMLFRSFVNWVIALVIAFYLLKDRDYFLQLIKYFIPVNSRQEVLRLAGEINKVLTRFIRGQLLVALIVGALSTVGFLLVRLNFALLLGMVTGAANIIPYFGPILGGVPVVIVGLMESPAKALWALGVVILVQQLESGIITPKIVGKSIGVHPVFIILSIFIAAKFFGILGMVLAVPVTAVVKVMFIYFFNRITYRG